MTREIRDLLNKFFAEMRRRGLLAKQDFEDCSSCAGESLTSTVVSIVRDAAARKVKNRVAVRRLRSLRGVVYYHRQDAKTLDRFGWLWTRFSGVDTVEYGHVGLPKRLVGEQVVNVLRSLDIPHQWDGQEDSCVLVRFDLLDRPMSIVPCSRRG